MTDIETERPETRADDHQTLMSEPAAFYGDGPGPADPVRSAMRSLLRSWWIIVLCGVIAVAAGIGVEGRQTKTYSATTYVLLAGNSFQQAITGGYNATNIQNLEATVVGYLTPARQDLAAHTAGVPLNSAWSLDTSPSATSSVLPITASTENPRTAAALADAAANEIVAVNNASDEAQLKEARAVIRTQVKNAPTKNMKRTLFGQLNTLATLQALSNHSIQIIQKAQVPGSPSSPSRKRTAAIALALGLVVGIVIALLRPERRRRSAPAVAG